MKLSARMVPRECLDLWMIVDVLRLWVPSKSGVPDNYYGFSILWQMRQQFRIELFKLCIFVVRDPIYNKRAQ